ncbi:hypothetical protein QVD99_007483 [Batrachochytrium dendrobatidis]|nr:hypothetical protein O5D80_008356 [Batrachochytrium dendrobatidis]KAK5665857.1 hypothetical protein QVD99_007483 [Batrachochytrium dendrobatidis]
MNSSSSSSSSSSSDDGDRGFREQYGNTQLSSVFGDGSAAPMPSAMSVGSIENGLTPLGLPLNQSTTKLSSNAFNCPGSSASLQTLSSMASSLVASPFASSKSIHLGNCDRPPLPPSNLSIASTRFHSYKADGNTTSAYSTPGKQSGLRLNMSMNITDASATDAGCEAPVYSKMVGFGCESMSGGSDLGSPMSIGSMDESPFSINRKSQIRRQTSYALFSRTSAPTTPTANRRMSLDFGDGLANNGILSTPAPKSIHRILDSLKKESRPFESEIEHERVTNTEVAKIFADPQSPMQMGSVTPPDIPGSSIYIEGETVSITPRTPIPVSQLKDPLIYYSQTSKLNPESSFLSRREQSTSPSSPLLLCTRSKRKLSTTEFVLDRIEGTRSVKRAYHRLPSSPRTLVSPSTISLCSSGSHVIPNAPAPVRPACLPSNAHLNGLFTSMIHGQVGHMGRSRSGSGSSISSMSSMISDRTHTMVPATSYMAMDRTSSLLGGSLGAHTIPNFSHQISSLEPGTMHDNKGISDLEQLSESEPIQPLFFSQTNPMLHTSIHVSNQSGNSMHTSPKHVGYSRPGVPMLNLSGAGTDFSRMSLSDENVHK